MKNELLKLIESVDDEWTISYLYGYCSQLIDLLKR